MAVGKALSAVPMSVVLLAALLQPQQSRAMPITFDFEAAELTLRTTFPSQQSPTVIQRGSVFGGQYSSTAVTLLQDGQEVASVDRTDYQIFPQTRTSPSTYFISDVMTCTCGIFGVPDGPVGITVTLSIADPTGLLTQNTITDTIVIDDEQRVVDVPAVISSTDLFANSRGELVVDFGTSVISRTLTAVVDRTADVVAEPSSLLIASLGFAALGVGARWHRRRR